MKRKLRFDNQCFLNGHFEALLVKSLGSFFWHIRISWDHLTLIDTFSNCLLGLPDGTMRPNWGNLFWETVIHCGAMEARSSCQCSLALSPILLLILFISQNIVSLFFLHVLKRCQNLQLPSALFSDEAFKDVANPEDIPKYASSATNSTNYAVNSVPSPPGPRPCGPSGSQGLVAFSWRGFGNRDSWDLWPPGLQHHSHHRQQPIKTRSFPLQTQWKSLQIPSHHFNSCFILGYKTELSTNPWLSIRTSSSVGLVWLDDSGLQFVPGYRERPPGYLILDCLRRIWANKPGTVLISLAVWYGRLMDVTPWLDNQEMAVSSFSSGPNLKSILLLKKVI